MKKMLRFLLTCAWEFLKLLAILGVVYVVVILLLSGQGMPSPSQLITSVLDFIAEQVQVVIHWFQARLGFR
ncbi:hypothetical protein ACLSY4_04115 [Enterococcus gallinarum]|uniref:hypothetical protein n=2 Tax=Enterococcus TaxID=1350 RepID=UPI00161281F1|nr:MULTISPECIES: hypothetical protein [Enterococcus]